MKDEVATKMDAMECEVNERADNEMNDEGVKMNDLMEKMRKAARESDKAFREKQSKKEKKKELKKKAEVEKEKIRKKECRSVKDWRKLDEKLDGMKTGNLVSTPRKNGKTVATPVTNGASNENDDEHVKDEMNDSENDVENEMILMNDANLITSANLLKKNQTNSSSPAKSRHR